jgi:hypothetical protein
MRQVLDVRISHLGSLPGCTFYPDCIPAAAACNHITFVQVHTASLAWAPFNAGCDEPGVVSSRVLGDDTDVVQDK